MSTMTAPPRPREMNRLPADTARVPFRKSTRALSAIRTSDARSGSRGLTFDHGVVAVGGDDVNGTADQLNGGR